MVLVQYWKFHNGQRTNIISDQYNLFDISWDTLLIVTASGEQASLGEGYMESHIPHSQSDSTILCHTQDTDLANKACKISLQQLTPLCVL